MNVQQVKAHKTTDGKLFEDKAEAERHQAEVDLDKKLNEFVDTYCYNGMERTSIFDMLKEQRDELVSILKR